MLGGEWGGCSVSSLVLIPLCTSLNPSRNVFCPLKKFVCFSIPLLCQCYCPSGVWAKDKLCACGKYLCGCSSLCISNSWTHVTACWTHWTLSALKQCWSKSLQVLAWISRDLEQGGRHWWEKNRWTKVDWKREGWEDIVMGKHNRLSAFILLAVTPVHIDGAFTLGCRNLPISLEAWESEDLSSALDLTHHTTFRKSP